MTDYRTIVNPPIPYFGPIPRSSLYSDKCVKIRGSAPTTANRFYINLYCGPGTTPEYDIALRITVHMIGGYITLNSFNSGFWGDDHHGTLPINCNKEFEIVIVHGSFGYKIIIDGEHYTDFKPILLSDSATHLAINGNVSIFEISYEALSDYRNRVISEMVLGQVSQRSVGISLRENNRGDFERVVSPLPFSDSSPPPSYEAAIESSKRAPYPTADPIGMPLLPINGHKDLLPYPLPTPPTVGPLPSRIIGIYPPPECSNVTTPPTTEATVPINRNNSAYAQSAEAKSRIFSKGRCLIIIGMIGGAIIFIMKYIWK